MVKRDNEIIFILPNGKEIASMTVCTMETDEKLENGEFKTVPTKNFWLRFHQVEYDSGMIDCAAAYVEE